jgi:hypothetical protein
MIITPEIQLHEEEYRPWLMAAQNAGYKPEYFGNGVLYNHPEIHHFSCSPWGAGHWVDSDGNRLERPGSPWYWPENRSILDGGGNAAVQERARLKTYKFVCDTILIHCQKEAIEPEDGNWANHYPYRQFVIEVTRAGDTYSVTKVETKINSQVCPVGETAANFVGGMTGGGVFAAVNGWD